MTSTGSLGPRCLAPWYHSHVTPSGDRALCCHAKPFEQNHNILNEDFNSFWHGQEMANIRKTFLSGKFSSQYCGACINSEDYSEAPFHQYQLSPDKIKSIIKKESDALELPTYLDYRIDNTCNLACRSCSGGYSSRIEKIEKQIYGEGFNTRKGELKEKQTNEFLDLLNEGEVTKLYFANGEPLLQKEHWELLKILSENKSKAPRITLEYNTNLFHDAFFDSEKREILNKFKKIRLGISLDSVSENVEFIRDGIKWSKFLERYNKLKGDDLYEILSIDITFSLPLLLNVSGLASFLLNERASYTIQMINGNGYSVVLSPEILKPRLQRQLYKKALLDIQSIDKNSELKDFRDFLENRLSKTEKNLPIK